MVARELRLSPEALQACYIRKRSIDARQRQVYVNLTVEAYLEGEPLPELDYADIRYPDVSEARAVIVVGAGPAGLFAALRLVELGLKPILLERGKAVHERRRDLRDIERTGQVDPESNYGYGEGGAGAFSDGKLYTRSKKRGSVERILKILCYHGADPKILVDAHPHLGTDKLPKVIENIRKTILSSGGEVHFSACVEELLLEGNRLEGVRLRDGRVFLGPVILATGHSTRDIYRQLYQKGIALEAKPIAVGVRIEHPQQLIDEIRYHSPEGRSKYLPAAEYVYKAQVRQRGVYSFCMCPGGFIVPAATGPNEQVVNGMSPANRGSRWANSGMVVEIRVEDLASEPLAKGLPQDVLQMLHYTERLEALSYEAAHQTLHAPAQRLTDFLSGKISTSLPRSSYPFPLTSSRLQDWMPKGISSRLAEAFRVFGKASRGFITEEAQLLAIESRTSAPVRIPRDASFQHIEIEGLYPAGEGAGYAGGIVSAAIDGENVATAVAARSSQ